MTDFDQARDALTKAAKAADKIPDHEKQADTLTAIGHAFIRLGEVSPKNAQPSLDDLGTGFQAYTQSR